MNGSATELLANGVATTDIPVMRGTWTLETERFRAMSADEKVRLAHALWTEAREVIAAGVRARYPTWSEDQVAARVRELMRDAGA